MISLDPKPSKPCKGLHEKVVLILPHNGSTFILAKPFAFHLGIDTLSIFYDFCLLLGSKGAENDRLRIVEAL